MKASAVTTSTSGSQRAGAHRRVTAGRLNGCGIRCAGDPPTALHAEGSRSFLGRAWPPAVPWRTSRGGPFFLFFGRGNRGAAAQSRVRRQF